MDNLNVALLSDAFPPALDGVSNVVKNYADILSKNGNPVSVLTPQWPGADDSGLPYDVIRYPSLDTREQIGYVTGIPFMPKLVEKLRPASPDILHSHCPTVSQILGMELAPVLDVPLVFTYHTKYDQEIRREFRGKLIQDNVARILVDAVSMSDEVWTVSRGAGENLRSMGYEGEYFVMPNGSDMPLGQVDDETMRSAVNGYDLPETVPVFLFVGRMIFYKGQRLILEALEGLHSQGVDFRMVFVGAGEDLPEMQALANQLGIGEKVIFTGTVRDREKLRGWYRRADLLVFPSTFDTNGLVVREAAASSTPAVLVKDSCAAEGVIDGQNGYLVTESASSLAVKLYQLIQNRDRLQETGERAKKELYLSWEDAVKMAEGRYRSVLERYRSGDCQPKSTRKRVHDDLFRIIGDLLEAREELKSGEWRIL